MGKSFDLNDLVTRVQLRSFVGYVDRLLLRHLGLESADLSGLDVDNVNVALNVLYVCEYERNTDKILAIMNTHQQVFEVLKLCSPQYTRDLLYRCLHLSRQDPDRDPCDLLYDLSCRYSTRPHAIDMQTLITEKPEDAVWTLHTLDGKTVYTNIHSLRESRLAQRIKPRVLSVPFNEKLVITALKCLAYECNPEARSAIPVLRWLDYDDKEWDIRSCMMQFHKQIEFRQDKLEEFCLALE